jgi:DNA-binding XRE family transcriptional regulator
MKTKEKTTTNALEILKHRYYKLEKHRLTLEEARINAEAARLIYKLRTEAKLSQKELADLIGTTQSVISRLEDDDYEGHSLGMLTKITAALHKKLHLVTESVS